MYTVFNHRKKMFLWECALLFCMFIGIVSIGLRYEMHTPHTAFQGTKKIEITSGLGSRKIGALLKKEGFIRSKWAFVTHVSLLGEASDLKPGTYVFSNHATIVAIARDLVAGAGEFAITIPEGWNMQEIGAYLDQQGITSKKDFVQIVNLNATSTYIQSSLLSRFAFLEDRPPHAGLEGYLFPDTYRFFTNTSAEQVATRMLQNFNTKFSDALRQETIRQDHTIFEIVTMASLLEKEAATDKDRELVSDILWKRLQLNMPLQVDATIIFLTGKHNIRVSYEDTRITSPYNTYSHTGLPAGPIANPGLSAIHATLFPKKSLYLYYLSAPDGRIFFSRTLDEHNRAKAKYLK